MMSDPFSTLGDVGEPNEPVAFGQESAPEPVPDAEAAPDPEPVAEVQPEPEPEPEPEAAEAPAEAVSATAGAPDPVPPPFIPEGALPTWHEAILRDLHDRLRALGG